MKPDLCTNEKSHIAYEILAYLAEHPDSGDTLEGIVEWWLLERKIKFQTSQVKEAIVELVDRGLILEQNGMDSKIHYSINQSKYEEVQKFFKQKCG